LVGVAIEMKVVGKGEKRNCKGKGRYVLPGPILLSKTIELAQRLGKAQKEKSTLID